MTSMKKIIAVLVMTLMVGCAIFAEGHKRQKIVICSVSSNTLATVTRDVKSGKAVIKEPKMPEGDIPEGWHVVQMYVEDISANTKRIYLILEEN